jgi:hypothetical protein
VPTLALPNIWQELVAKFLVKESFAHVLPTFWQESVRERDGHALAAKFWLQTKQ